MTLPEPIIVQKMLGRHSSLLDNFVMLCWERNYAPNFNYLLFLEVKTSGFRLRILRLWKSALKQLQIDYSPPSVRLHLRGIEFRLEKDDVEAENCVLLACL
eukprot:UN02546